MSVNHLRKITAILIFRLLEIWPGDLAKGKHRYKLVTVNQNPLPSTVHKTTGATSVRYHNAVAHTLHIEIHEKEINVGSIKLEFKANGSLLDAMAIVEDIRDYFDDVYRELALADMEDSL